MLKAYFTLVLILTTVSTINAQITATELIARHKEVMSGYSQGIDEEAPVIKATGTVAFMGIETSFTAYLKNSMLRVESQAQLAIINDSLRWLSSPSGHSFDASFDLGYEGLIRNKDKSFIDLLEKGYQAISIQEALLLDSIKAYNLIMEKGDEKVYCYFDQESYYFIGYKERGSYKQRYFLNHQAIANYLWPKTYILKSYEDQSVYQVTTYSEVKSDEDFFSLSPEAQKAYYDQTPMKEKPEIVSAMRMLYFEGIELLDKQEYEKAIEIFDLSLKKNPENHKILNMRALARAGLGNYDKALEDFNLSIKTAPNSASTYDKMGSVKYRMSDIPGALEAYLRSVELDSTNVNVHYKIAQIYHLDKKDYKKSYEAFSQVIKYDPYFEECYYARGSASMMLGDDQMALGDYKKAQALGLNDGRLFSAMGMVLGNLNELEQAVAAFQKAMSLGWSNLYDKKSLVFLLIELGRYNELIEPANDVLQKEPKDNLIRNARGVALFSINEFSEAKKDFDVLVKDPQWAEDAWYYRGVCKMMMSEHLGAIKDFTELLKFTESGAVYFMRGQQYLLVDKQTEGCSDIKKAEQLRQEGAKDFFIANCER